MTGVDFQPDDQTDGYNNRNGGMENNHGAASCVLSYGMRDERTGACRVVLATA